MNNVKFHAFYIPINKPVLMNDIDIVLNTDNDINNGSTDIKDGINDADSHTTSRNISENDYIEYFTEKYYINNNYATDSLVLVKFTNINDMFDSKPITNMYSKVKKNDVKNDVKNDKYTPLFSCINTNCNSCIDKYCNW